MVIENINIDHQTTTQDFSTVPFQDDVGPEVGENNFFRPFLFKMCIGQLNLTKIFE